MQLFLARISVKYLIFCIISTVLLKILIAFPFGLTKKKLIPIAVVSVITQLYLFVYFFDNGFDDVLIIAVVYPIVVLLVFLTEAIVYSAIFGLITVETAPVWKSILYSFTANVATLIVGFIMLCINELLF